MAMGTHPTNPQDWDGDSHHPPISDDDLWNPGDSADRTVSRIDLRKLRLVHNSQPLLPLLRIYNSKPQEKQAR